jgi:hypothetical protein
MFFSEQLSAFDVSADQSRKKKKTQCNETMNKTNMRALRASLCERAKQTDIQLLDAMDAHGLDWTVDEQCVPASLHYDSGERCLVLVDNEVNSWVDFDAALGHKEDGHYFFAIRVDNSLVAQFWRQSGENEQENEQTLSFDESFDWSTVTVGGSDALVSQCDKDVLTRLANDVVEASTSFYGIEALGDGSVSFDEFSSAAKLRRWFDAGTRKPETRVVVDRFYLPPEHVGAGTSGNGRADTRCERRRLFNEWRETVNGQFGREQRYKLKQRTQERDRLRRDKKLDFISRADDL